MNPIDRVREWLEEANACEHSDATAFSLATCGADGRPSARMVLLKGVDQRGIVFYTNLASRKASNLRENPHAEACFHWPVLERQVRLAGPVEPVTSTEADTYFASRARSSQIGAWASKQSQPMADRGTLERAVSEYTAQFADREIPRPPWWSGFRIRPDHIEFWRGMDFRLHERVIYRLQGTAWHSQMLFP